MASKINENLLVGESNEKVTNVISQYRFQQIREMALSGKKGREIAAKLKMSRKTVNKFLRTNSAPRYNGRTAGGPTLVMTIQPEVDRILSKNNGNSRREVRRLLQRDGLDVSLGTVGRAMAVFRRAVPKERFFSQIFEAGEQMQVDFKEEFVLPFEDGPKTVQLFMASLPHSNVAIGTAFSNKTFVCFANGLQKSFEFFGGVPKNLRFDNLSPCVTKVGRGSDRTYTQAFEAATKHYGFGLLPCSPGKGSDKGDIERDIQSYARWIQNAVKNDDLVFGSFEELNKWLADFFRTQWADSSRQKFEVEKSALRPVPVLDESVLCKMVSIVVPSNGIVKIEKRCFSVPDSHIGLTCDVLLGCFQVEIRPIIKGFSSIFHPALSEGKSSILLEHVLTSLLRKPKAMVRWEHREVLFPNASSKDFYAALQKFNESSAERAYLKCLNHILNHSWGEVLAAMELCQSEQNPQRAFEELMLPSSKEILKSEPAELVPDLASFDALIPQIERFIHELTKPSVELKITEINIDGKPTRRSEQPSTDAGTQPGGVSPGTDAKRTSEPNGTENQKSLEEIKEPHSKTADILFFERSQRDHSAGPRQSCEGGLGAQRKQCGALWEYRSWKDPHSTWPYPGAVPAGLQLLVYDSSENDDPTHRSETGCDLEQKGEGVGQNRSDRLRRGGVCFGDGGRGGAILPAHSQPLRAQEQSLYNESSIQSVGQGVYEAVGDTSCSRPDSSSLQDLPNQWPELSWSRGQTKPRGLDASGLSI